MTAGARNPTAPLAAAHGPVQTLWAASHGMNHKPHLLLQVQASGGIEAIFVPFWLVQERWVVLQPPF